MPYVTCSSCHLPAYSAARWSTTESCARCGAPLAAPVGATALPRADTGLVGSGWAPTPPSRGASVALSIADGPGAAGRPAA